MKKTCHLSFLLILCLLAYPVCAAAGMAESAHFSPLPESLTAPVELKAKAEQAPTQPDSKTTSAPNSLFDFRTSGGSSYITAYIAGNQDIAEIEVPASLGGLPVRGIDAGAFSNATGAKVIKLPPNLDRIDLDAFQGVEDSVLYVRGNSATARSIGMTGHHMVDLQWDRDDSPAEKAEPIRTGISGPFTYEILPDQTLRITACAVDIDKTPDLVVPSEIEGHPVRIIGTGAFINISKGYPTEDDYIEYGVNITLSEGIREIEEGAIVYTLSTWTPILTLPASLERIAAGGIKGGFAGVSLIIHPDNVNFCWKDSDGCLIDRDGWLLAYLGDQSYGGGSIRVSEGVRHIPGNVFNADAFITEIILPEGLLSIGDRSFNGMRLSRLQLPGTLRSLGASVLYNTSVTSLTLPRSLEVIQGHPSVDDNGNALFYDAEGNASARLAHIQIDENNPYLIIQDKAVFAKKHSALLFHLEPNALQSYSVPRGTKVIASRALAAAQHLSKINLPDGLQVIGNFALPMNGKPVTVNLPESVSFSGYNQPNNRLISAQPASKEPLSVRIEKSSESIALGQSISVKLDIRGGTPPFTVGYECIVYAFDATENSRPVVYIWKDNAGTEFTFTPYAEGDGTLDLVVRDSKGEKAFGAFDFGVLEEGFVPPAQTAPANEGLWSMYADETGSIFDMILAPDGRIKLTANHAAFLGGYLEVTGSAVVDENRITVTSDLGQVYIYPYRYTHEIIGGNRLLMVLSTQDGNTVTLIRQPDYVYTPFANMTGAQNTPVPVAPEYKQLVGTWKGEGRHTRADQCTFILEEDGHISFEYDYPAGSGIPGMKVSGIVLQVQPGHILFETSDGYERYMRFEPGADPTAMTLYVDDIDVALRAVSTAAPTAPPASAAFPAPLPASVPAARLFPPDINNLINGGAFVRDAQRFYAQHTGPKETYHLYQVTPDFQIGPAAMDRQRTDARYSIFHNRLYFYSVSEKKPGLYAFDMINGTVAGDGVKIGPKHAMVYAVDNTGVYYAVKGSQGIWRVDHNGGGKTKLSRHEVNAGNNIVRMMVYNDILYYINAADAQLYAVPTNGSAPAYRVGSEPMHYFILAEYRGKPAFVFVTYGKNKKQLEQSTLRAITIEGTPIDGLLGISDVRTRYINYLDGWLYYTDTAEGGILKRLLLDDPGHREPVLDQRVGYIHTFDGWIAVLPLNGAHNRYFIDTRDLSVHSLPAL